MKISAFKRIVKEDFDEKDQPLIEKLASIFNLFQEQVYYAFNNNITVDENLNAFTTSFKVRVDANGIPQGNGELKSTLKSRVKGVIVLSVRSYDNSLLTGSPFVSFSTNNNLITINQILGLTPGKDYDITLMILGS